MLGIVNLLKPPGMTSHDVVSWIRRNFKIKKVGHTGTLDPDVSGVLPICIGRATKVAQYLTEKEKSYRGELLLGIQTNTQDTSGEVLAAKDASHISTEDIRRVIEGKLGVQYQIPPMTSAVKVGGKALYQFAREGKEIERVSRRVEIFKLEILKITGLGTRYPRVLVDVECSKGTYIRTLFHDIGQELGVGGTMSFLLRTKSGSYNLNQAYTLDEITEALESNELQKVILPLESALEGFPPVLVRSGAVTRVKNGNRLYLPGVHQLPAEELGKGSLVYLSSFEGQEVLAIAKVYYDEENRISFQPITVF